MKYVMLIYQGTAPLPGSDATASLSEEEQKQIYADYAPSSREAEMVAAAFMRTATLTEPVSTDAA